MTDARHFLGMEQLGDPLHWRLEVVPELTTPGNFLFGGCGLGAALVALESAAQRPTVWATAQYLSYAPTDSVLDLVVTLAAEGSRVTQARAVGRVGDTEILTVNAALGAADSQGAEGVWEHPPDVPPPDECPPRLLPDFFRTSIFDQIEVRLARGRTLEDLVSGTSTPGEPTSALWARVPGHLEPSAATLAIFGDYVSGGVSQPLGRRTMARSLDNTLRVVAHRPERVGPLRHPHPGRLGRVRPGHRVPLVTRRRAARHGEPVDEPPVLVRRTDGRIAAVGRPGDPDRRNREEGIGRTMKISTLLSYSGGFRAAADQVAEWEKAGLDLVWVAEAYGLDGPSLMGYLAALTERVEIGSAILPIYTRTPALIAMTAAGIDTLSGGRFHLGLGSSGPQVVEGWHGVPYDAPLGRTREIVEICREVWAREAPLEHHGTFYDIPLPPGRGTGLGKALKIIAHPVRPRIPIWIASLGERNVALTAEVADGWIPMLFVPEKARDVWGASLDAGGSRREPSLGPLQISTGGIVAIGEGGEVRALRDLARPMVALYAGGMGAKGRNFYNDVVRRYGYEREAEQIQERYLSGAKREAEALVPDELLESMAICGPKGYVAERIAAFAEAGVTHLQVTPIPTGDQRPVDVIALVKEIAG